MKQITTLIILFFLAQNIIAQNIGIGTASPTSLLDVNGQLTIDQKNFGGYGGLLIKGDAPGSNYPNICFSIKNNAAQDIIAAYIGGNINSNTAGSEAMDIHFLTSSSGLGGLAERLRIKDNGNVGIGTPAPDGRLTVAGNTSVPQLKLYQGTASDFARIRLTNINGNTNNRFWDIAATIDAGAAANDRLNFYNQAGGNILSLGGSGNVGIGITSPGASLEIARGTGSNGTLKINGTTYDSRFNNGDDENTLIRGGKASSNVFVGDKGNGKIYIGGGSGNGDVEISNADANANIELRQTNAISGGTPYIDFTSDPFQDYNVRLILNASHELSITGGNLNVNGYTKLGGASSPAIKTLKLTGVTSLVPAGFVIIPHGLDASKILSVSILVSTLTGDYVPASYFNGTGLWYNYIILANAIKVVNPLLAIDYFGIIGRPLKIFITYEE
ncbi:MAG: hypothetical protein ABI707_06290 [Ferruginibacter sp.]